MAVANVLVIRLMAPMPTEQISKPRSNMARSPQLSGGLVRSRTFPCRAGHARISTVAAPCRSRTPARGVRHIGYRLLPFVLLHHLVNFLFDGFKVKRSRLLHRWILDGRLRQLKDFLLHQDEAPELAGIEVVHVTAAQVVQGLPAKRGRSFERILTEIDDQRHVRRGLFAGPAIGLLVELEFEVINPKGAKVRPAEVEHLAALRWPVAQ